MSEVLYEKWLPRAVEIDATRSLSVPLNVLLDEAPEVAAFLRHHWDPQTGTNARPGLSTALKQRPLSIAWGPELAEEILELQAATQYAQNQYVLTSKPAEPAPMERSEFVLSELTAVLEWYFDDGKEDEHDAQLDTLERSVGEPSTIAELASALEGYAAVADAVRSSIDGVIGFDVALIDEARALATQLRERDVPTDPEVQAKWLDHRRRLATLLWEREQLVRRAARVVFRHHPHIARLAASAYLRRQRARRRLEEREKSEG